MTSCRRSEFYLKNCPAVQIDGDHDGISCESALLPALLTSFCGNSPAATTPNNRLLKSAPD